MSDTNRKVELEKQIEISCSGLDEILFIIREREFDLEKFDRFYETVGEYYRLIKGDSSLDRVTAGYLHIFESMLFTTLDYHQALNTETKIQNTLQEAYNKFSSLTEKIYFGE
jgi:hypothetical protein